MPQYDVIIKSGEKDFHKIPQTVESLNFLNPQPENIYIVNEKGWLPIELSGDSRITAIMDKDVFQDCDRDIIPFRKNWCYSMFIASFQTFTKNDYYLDVNADNFFTAPLNLFDKDGKPIFFVSPQHDHYHKAYFDFSKAMFGIDRIGNDCFINDLMMYDKRLTRRMLDIHGSFNNFFIAACKIISPSCYPAEQEYYPNFVLKKFPKEYSIHRDVFTLMFGKVYPAQYTLNEIQAIIKRPVVAVTCHTWETPKRIKLINDTVNKEDINALCAWLQQEPIPNLTKGELTIELEKKWAYRIGTRYSVFVNSGSSAILLLLAAYKELLPEIGKIVVPALSWATDVSSPMILGYDIILCDCNMYDLSCDLFALEQIFIKEKPKFFLSVSVLGLVPDMDEISRLCKKHHVILIEDNCESLHSLIDNKMLGVFGHASVFSTYYGHHLSTVEGGFICTDDSALYNVLISMRSHGWGREWNMIDQKKEAKLFEIGQFDSQYAFYYPGFNFRSTDIQALIGIRMIDRMTEYATKRNDNFVIYLNEIKGNILKIEQRPGTFISSFAFPVVQPRREEIVKKLKDNGVETRPLIAGSMGQQPFWVKKYGKQLFNNADVVHKFGFYLPNHQDLPKEDIQLIINIVNKYA